MTRMISIDDPFVPVAELGDLPQSVPGDADIEKLPPSNGFEIILSPNAVAYLAAGILLLLTLLALYFTAALVIPVILAIGLYLTLKPVMKLVARLRIPRLIGAALRRLVEILPTFSNKKQAVEISREIERNISTYLATITLMNLLVGVLTGIVVHFCGLSDPVLWGTLVFLLNYVPIVGPLCGLGTLLLAVPLLATVKIVCDRIGSLMAIGHFLGGEVRA